MTHRPHKGGISSLTLITDAYYQCHYHFHHNQFSSLLGWGKSRSLGQAAMAQTLGIWAYSSVQASNAGLLASAVYSQEQGTQQDEADQEWSPLCFVWSTQLEGKPRHPVGSQAGDSKRRVTEGNMIFGDVKSQIIAVLSGHWIAQVSTGTLQEHLKMGTLIEVLPGLRKVCR